MFLNENPQFLNDMHDILNPITETEESNDGFVYGNCIVWPNLSDLSHSIKEELLKYFGFPEWGLIRKNRFIDTIENLDISEQIKEDALATIETMYDEDNNDDLIVELFRTLKVPSGTFYENDNSNYFPESEKYWQTYDDDELFLHGTKSIEMLYFETIDNLEKSRTLISEQFDDLILKSLLFSSFALSESFLKNIIVQKAEAEEADLGRTLNKLKNGKQKKELFSNLFNVGEEECEIPYWELRNILAHDINNVDVFSRIFLKNVHYHKNDSTIVNDSDNIISELKEYCAKIHDIYNGKCK